MTRKTYGRLRFGNFKGRRAWAVDMLEPHVAIAFKRIFTKVHAKLDVLILSDNDDTRADLDWFCMRYPLQTSFGALLEEGTRRVADRVAERDAILDLNWSPPAIAGTFRPGKKPYLYQSQASAIALKVKGLLLGDDVGLGKTITTFATAAAGAPLPMLVVVEAHLVRQWAKKAEEFTTYRVCAIKQGTPYNLPMADIYVISYNMLDGWMPVFKNGMFKTVVYDEIQQLRHGEKTSKGNAARVLSNKAQIRLGLTATPIYNYGDEIHTVMSYLQPDVLGTREEFLREWCKFGGTVKDPDALGSFLASTGHFLRRREDDASVDASLPPANIIEFQVAFDEGLMEKEEALLRALATTVLTGRFDQAGQAARELDVQMRRLTGLAKAKFVAAYVDMLLKDRPRVLLAGWHRDVYGIWNYALRKHNPIQYTGSESAAGKARNVERFCAGDSRVMMISLRSGAGLDGLQYHCRDLVYGELDWSPQVHYQLLGRLRRPGQEHIVDGHYLHADGGSDPVLMSLLGVKADQSRGIMDPGKAPLAQLADDSRIKTLARHLLGEA